MLNLPLSNSRNKAILRANLSERRGHETRRDASLEKKRKRQRERGARDRVSDPLFARNQPRDPPFLLIPRRYRRGQLSFGGDAQQVRVYIYIYIKPDSEKLVSSRTKGSKGESRILLKRQPIRYRNFLPK